MNVRRLQPSDFMDVWELGASYMDARLSPDMDRALNNYMLILSAKTNFSEGAFEGDRLIGAVMASTHKGAFASKSYGVMQFWFGPICLLDNAIAWWEGRPVLRFLSLQFPIHVRKGMYRMLRQRGFERQGDMNMLWR